MRRRLFDRLEVAEGLADKLVLGLFAALGLVMLIGLATASGHVTW
jgi:hypothetical protein